MCLHDVLSQAQGLLYLYLQEERFSSDEEFMTLIQEVVMNVLSLNAVQL